MKRKYLFKGLILMVLLSLALMSCDIPIENLPVGDEDIPEDIETMLETTETEEMEEMETEEPEETEEMEETETEEPEETEEMDESETEEMDSQDSPLYSSMLDCYQVEFMEKDQNEEGYTAWTYQVMEVDCQYDLSYWVLELPGCVRVESASPEPNELVKPDPNSNLYGIKWETGAGFESGTFTVVTEEDWDEGSRRVSAKGPDLWFGEITGPTCGGDWDDEDWDNDYWEGEDHSDDDMDDETSYEDVYIPEGQYPPPGECKLWDPDLDDGQQSEPIPCDCSYVEPGTFLIDHLGEVVDCEMEYHDDDDMDDETSYEDVYIPEGQYPPPGECKLWDPHLDDGQQSEPIPCECSYVEPGTFLIDHEGEVFDCEMDDDYDDEEMDDNDVDDDDYDDDEYDEEMDDDDVDDDDYDNDNDNDDDYDDDDDDDEIDDDGFCMGVMIPEGQYPPPGQCKLWDPELDDGQQSEPIPCECSYVEPGTCLINHDGDVVDCGD